MARTNGGYLHRADMIALGGSDAVIRAAVRSGQLVRLRVGTYALPEHLEGLTPEQRHLLLARSVVDKFEHGSVALSHHSAAAAHGLSLFDVDLETVHLVRLDAGAGRAESGVHHHRRLEGAQIVTIDDGRLALAPEWCTWQVACANSLRSGVVVMDSGIHHGLLLPDSLAEFSGRFRRWQGGRQADVAARLADGSAATPGETLYRYVCFEGRLPRPTTQHVVHDMDTGKPFAWTDLGWPDFRHVGEFDGVRKYHRDLRPGEDVASAVIREKLREDRIRATGLGMSRASWRDVLPGRSRDTASRLAVELEQSRRLHTPSRRHIA